MLSVLSFADLGNLYVWVTLGLMISYAALGFIDDFKKVRVQNARGVRAKTKLVWQVLLAMSFTALLIVMFPILLILFCQS